MAFIRDCVVIEKRLAPTAIARAIDSRSVVAGPFRFDVTL